MKPTEHVTEMNLEKMIGALNSHLFQLWLEVIMILGSRSNARTNALAARSPRSIAEVAAASERSELDATAADLRPKTALTVETSLAARPVTAG